MKATEFITEGLQYKGYPCTKDCSGHMAGYQWAKERNVQNPAEVSSAKSNSFYEGCLSFIEGK